MRPAVISAPMLARLMGVSRPTIYTKMTRGEIKEIRFGNRRLVPVAEAERVTGLPYHPDWEERRT